MSARAVQSCLQGLVLTRGSPGSLGTAGLAAGRLSLAQRCPSALRPWRDAWEGEFGDSYQLLSALSYIVVLLVSIWEGAANKDKG